MLKKALICGLFLFWLALITVLVENKFFRTDDGPPRLDFTEGEYQIGIMHGGARVGAVRVLSSPGAVRAEGGLLLNMAGLGEQADFSGSAFFAPCGRVENFHLDLTAGGSGFQLSGTDDGSGLLVFAGGAGSGPPIRLGRSISRADLYMPKIILQPGEKRMLEVRSPVTGLADRVLLEGVSTEYLNGEKVFVMEARQMNYSVRVWTDGEGEIIKAEMPMGFTLVREEAEDFRPVEISAEEGVDIRALSAVCAGVEIEDARLLKKMTAAVGGIDPEELDIISPRQRLNSEGFLEIFPESGPEEIVPLFFEEGPMSGRYLSPGLLIASDDMRIRERALLIARGAQDAWTAAKRINAWLYINMEKVPAAGVPSSLAVLSSMEGDCTEHTVLFTALARSIGIPSEICTGLVYHEGEFRYHSWPKVFIGRWIEMDPTLGMDVVGAAHIKLIEGGIHKQLALAGIADKISIEIIGLEYD